DREWQATLSVAETATREPGFSFLSHPLHCARIVCPMKFELICERPCQTIQIRKQCGLSNVHPVQFAHSFVPDFVGGNDKLDQGFAWIGILLENFFDRFM